MQVLGLNKLYCWKIIKDMVKMVTYTKNLEELDIPPAVVTTDILKEKKFPLYKRLDRRSSSS